MGKVMGSIINCGTHADLGHVEDLHQQLLAGFAKSKALTLDVSALVSADLSFVQLIEAARTQAANDGKQFALSAPPPEPLASLVEASGLLWERNPSDLQFWSKGEAGQ
jgi:anti-anti-sigma regulatory factor